MTKTTKLELELNSAIEAIVPLLNAASELAHKIKEAEANDDPTQADFNRLLDLGYLTDCACRLCGPNLHLLVQVMFALLDSEQGDDEVEQHQHQPH